MKNQKTIEKTTKNKGKNKKTLEKPKKTKKQKKQKTIVYPGGLVLLLGAGWLANHKENPTQTPSNWLHFAFRVYGYWAAAAPGEGAPGLYPGPAPPPQAEPHFPSAAGRAAGTSWNLLRLTGHLKSRLKLYKNH